MVSAARQRRRAASGGCHPDTLEETESTMIAITEIDAALHAVPLPETLSDAKHGDHTHFELIVARIGFSDGSAGTGYCYTGGRGGHAILAMIEHDLAPFLLGRDGSRESRGSESSLFWLVLEPQCPVSPTCTSAHRSA